jgi:hypothetical protein
MTACTCSKNHFFEKKEEKNAETILVECECESASPTKINQTKDKHPFKIIERIAKHHGHSLHHQNFHLGYEEPYRFFSPRNHQMDYH